MQRWGGGKGKGWQEAGNSKAGRGGGAAAALRQQQGAARRGGDGRRRRRGAGEELPITALTLVLCLAHSSSRPALHSCRFIPAASMLRPLAAPPPLLRPRCAPAAPLTRLPPLPPPTRCPCTCQEYSLHSANNLRRHAPCFAVPHAPPPLFPHLSGVLAALRRQSAPSRPLLPPLSSPLLPIHPPLMQSTPSTRCTPPTSAPSWATPSLHPHAPCVVPPHAPSFLPPHAPCSYPLTPPVLPLLPLHPSAAQSPSPPRAALAPHRNTRCTPPTSAPSWATPAAAWSSPPTPPAAGSCTSLFHPTRCRPTRQQPAAAAAAAAPTTSMRSCAPSAAPLPPVRSAASPPAAL